MAHELGGVPSWALTSDLFERARHPYTRGLLRSIPTLEARDRPLAVIPGSVPDAARKPPGCPFHPRCPRAVERCTEHVPPTEPESASHTFACWNTCPSA